MKVQLRFTLIELFTIAVMLSASVASAADAPIRKRAYGKECMIVPGNFNQQEAWAEARRRGGKPIVFTHMDKHKAVVDAFGPATIAKYRPWTGHYQRPDGIEPVGGWTTYGGGRSARIRRLFNSDGPDDGITNGLSWMFDGEDSTVYVTWGPNAGKQEDGAVMWHDNNNLLEDVSVNFRSAVMIEF